MNKEYTQLKEFIEKFREGNRRRSKKYRDRNREKLRTYNREYMRERRKLTKSK